MIRRLRIGLTLVVLTSDHSILEQQLDEHDEVSFIQQGVGILAADSEDRPRSKLARSLIFARGKAHAKDVNISTKPSRPTPQTLMGLNTRRPYGEVIQVIERKHLIALYLALPLAITVMAVFTISSVLEAYEITIVPEAAFMILAGMMLGVYAKRSLQLEITMDELGGDVYTFLSLVLLPIIIFASGWSLRRRDFFSQFPYILIFATAGVAVSAFVIGSFIHWTAVIGLHHVTSWRAAFTFGTLVSATDPVSVLVTYQKLKVDPLLNILVYGEATINDAVAITLFHVFNRNQYWISSASGALAGQDLCLSIARGVVEVFFGSAAIGFAFACIGAFIVRVAPQKNKKGQILTIFGLCYLTYIFAESFEFSGILANLFCGIISGIYLRPHLSAEGSIMATFFLQQVATLADSAVFVLIGVCAILADLPSYAQTVEGFTFCGLVVLFCLLGRAFAVFPLSFLSNYLKKIDGASRGVPQSRWNLITPSHMLMMWHAGLRGGIALALSMEIGHWVNHDMDGNVHHGTRRLLQAAVFVLVWVCLLVFGGTTAPSLKYLCIETGKDFPPDHLSKNEDSGWLRSKLLWLDQRMLAPLLIGNKMHQDEAEPDVEDVLSRTLSNLPSMPVPGGQSEAFTPSVD